MRVDFNQSKNEDFAKDALSIPAYPLDAAVIWIQDNLEPEEVFTLGQLDRWAFDNGFHREIE